ncbi:hypothetical protein IPU70_22475 [Achromobacter sp. SD115]|uniref:hypothetical protein n=1 Tax=Achromobacter sp. SD115 TaxID=2782011 RepID=UPI001A9631F6|nr:hypothetical protein [Achromobacter sp. SD115]MBO1016347.1 hypothetical protein [Achromobacter sp. SD115]
MSEAIWIWLIFFEVIFGSSRGCAVRSGDCRAAASSMDGDHWTQQGRRQAGTEAGRQGSIALKSIF